MFASRICVLLRYFKVLLGGCCVFSLGGLLVKKVGETDDMDEECDNCGREECVPEEETSSIGEPFIFTGRDDESSAENYEYGDEYSPYDSV